ncbi:hypothetical protein CCACVL1_04283 [Corchorus capsularis]|uniref:AIPP2-like SPOC-like domain-containing protein n=1 Tax=Corchorus capsularis TaxID=210143 RepID=A0A1R3JTL9_COCAP|nr:hypothetical protein CCACVL1_04283 [Corchorus capsularis]
MEANKSLVPGKNNIASSGGNRNGKRKHGRSTTLRPEEGVDFISKGEPSSKKNSAVSNGPIICPVWRGCFRIRTEKFGLSVDLVAHASKKSSEEVFNLASRLPAQLDLQVLPILDVYSGFGIPTLDIGLVDLNIFAENERSETDSDNLINRLLNEGLAMKTMVSDNVLLVFTSHHLPYKYWRSEEANVLPVDTTLARVSGTAEDNNFCISSNKQGQQMGKQRMESMKSNELPVLLLESCNYTFDSNGSRKDDEGESNAEKNAAKSIVEAQLPAERTFSEENTEKTDRISGEADSNKKMASDQALGDASLDAGFVSPVSTAAGEMITNSCHLNNASSKLLVQGRPGRALEGNF